MRIVLVNMRAGSGYGSEAGVLTAKIRWPEKGMHVSDEVNRMQYSRTVAVFLFD